MSMKTFSSDSHSFRIRYLGQNICLINVIPTLSTSSFSLWLLFLIFVLGPIEETRKKKKGKKFMINLVLALFIIKSVLMPIAIKVMAVMSSVSVVLSTMSLIISSLIGYSKLAWRHAGPTIKFIQGKDPWSKDENIITGLSDGLDYLGPSSGLGHDIGTGTLEHLHYYQK